MYTSQSERRHIIIARLQSSIQKRQREIATYNSHIFFLDAAKVVSSYVSRLGCMSGEEIYIDCQKKRIMSSKQTYSSCPLNVNAANVALDKSRVTCDLTKCTVRTCERVGFSDVYYACVCDDTKATRETRYDAYNANSGRIISLNKTKS